MKKIQENLPEILLALIQTIDRNTDETARLKEKQAEFMEKLFPELEKTETVKRMSSDRKERLRNHRDTLKDLGL